MASAKERFWRDEALIKLSLGLFFLAGKQQGNRPTRAPKWKTRSSETRHISKRGETTFGVVDGQWRKPFRGRKVLKSISLKPVTANNTFMSVPPLDLNCFNCIDWQKLLETEERGRDKYLYQRIIFKSIKLFNQARVIWRAHEFIKCCISFINLTAGDLSREGAEKIIPLIRAY